MISKHNIMNTIYFEEYDDTFCNKTYYEFETLKFIYMYLLV